MLISLCAHWSKSEISICWRHLVTSKEWSYPIFFFGKDRFYIIRGLVFCKNYRLFSPYQPFFIHTYPDNYHNFQQILMKTHGDLTNYSEKYHKKFQVFMSTRRAFTLSLRLHLSTFLYLSSYWNDILVLSSARLVCELICMKPWSIH